MRSTLVTTPMAGPTDVLVLRGGTEGLSTEPYAERLRQRLPERRVRLARTPSQAARAVTNARVVTGVDLDEALLPRAERLELFACTFSGTDHLPLHRLAEAGVAVTTASGVHAPGLAEQAVGAMLGFARRLHEGWRRERQAEWRHYQADELAGSTVTVIGLGAVGQAVARRLVGFDVDTIGVRYTPRKGGPTDEVVGYEPEALHGALSRSGYVVLACPLTDTTRGLIGEAELATLPPDAVLVNVARGAIVDTDALVDALCSNGIRGAALDVTDPEPLPPDHPLWGLDNCRITPHMGGSTPEHWDRRADILTRNLDRLDAGDQLENLVLAPGDD